MTRLSPASAVTTPPQGAAFIEKKDLTADMTMRIMNFTIARAARPSEQPVKVGGSYAPEELHRAVVAGSGQVGLSNLETCHTSVRLVLCNLSNI